MTFSVSRTSVLDNSSPCEEAVQRDGGWIVELEDWAALNRFVRKYGLVLLACSDIDLDDPIPGIEIYDSYRE